MGGYVFLIKKGERGLLHEKKGLGGSNCSTRWLSNGLFSFSVFLIRPYRMKDEAS